MESTCEYNKQSWTTDKEQSSQLEGWQEANNALSYRKCLAKHLCRISILNKSCDISKQRKIDVSEIG
jgi:hypothetical protein